MSSLVSAKGPSTTVRLPPVYLIRQPAELGCRPVPSSSTPALASCSWYFAISAMRLSSGITPASDSLVAFTTIMKRIVYLLSFSSLPGHDNHPAHAEAVGDHTEARREEGFAERHAHLPPLGQRVE